MAKGEKREHPFQTILGLAMTDGEFCELLLFGNRQELLPKFKLTEEERRFLLGIKPDSLQTFAAAVDQWLEARSQPKLDLSDLDF